MCWPCSPLVADFNSRSCEGATSGFEKLLRAFGISTHAPVKERPAHPSHGQR